MRRQFLLAWAAASLSANVCLAQVPGGDFFNVETCRDSPYYDSFYHTKGVIIPLDQLGAVEREQWQYEFHCGECGQKYAMCWRVYKGPPPTLPNRPAAVPMPGPPRNPQQPASDCAGLVAQARATAAAIEGGNTGPGPMLALTNVLQHCPPAFPRPIQCFDMMADAQSKVRTNPDYSKRRAQEAVGCYEGAPPPIRHAANPPPIPPTPQPQPPQPRRGGQPGPGDRYCQDAPGRPKVRSDLDIDRKIAAGVALVDYQTAQSSPSVTALQGGVTATVEGTGGSGRRPVVDFAYPDKRTGKPCHLKVEQYPSDYCAWWWSFRKVISNAFDHARKLDRATGSVAVNFVVTIDRNTNTPVLIYDGYYYPAVTTQHMVRGSNQPTTLSFSGPGYIAVVKSAIGDINRFNQIPPLPADMANEFQKLPSLIVQDATGKYLVHGVYFHDSFGASAPSFYLPCFTWLETNHSTIIEGTPFQLPAENPTLNTDLDPY
jgi:hypothetical protein